MITLTGAVAALSKMVKEQQAEMRAQPREMAALKQTCDVSAARTKRERDAKPEKRTVMQQLDVLEDAMLSLKKARRGLDEVIVQVPRRNETGDLEVPLEFDRVPAASMDAFTDVIADLEKAPRMSAACCFCGGYKPDRLRGRGGIRSGGWPRKPGASGQGQEEGGAESDSAGEGHVQGGKAGREKAVWLGPELGTWERLGQQGSWQGAIQLRISA